MAATWTLGRIETRCGCCGCCCAAGALVLELRLLGIARPKYRCQACGEPHRPLTDADLEALPAAPVEQPVRPTPAPTPVRRLRLVRGPQSWASLAESTTGLFDYGKAAAGDRE